MEAIVSVVAAQGRRLTARDCKTLCLATLGGLLEFYDFIIFVFFANTIGELFFPPEIPDWLRQFQTFGVFAAGYLARPLGGVVALSLWLAGCNKQQPVAQGPPAPEVTVSKPEQKEGVNWNEFTGRTANALIAFVVSQVCTTHWSITPLTTWLNVERNCPVRFWC